MIQLPALITDLTLILGAAAVVTLIFRKLKQPVVLGYIIAGLLIGPNCHLFPTVIEHETIKTWADIGVIFLLFGLGLEFSFKKLLKVGGVAIITASIEVTLTLLLGYGVGMLLGWNSINCLFFGGILSIASTTIIIRAFEEAGVKNEKFAGIVTGVLVIEDLVAVLLMVLLSTVAVSQTFAGGEMFRAVFKLGFFLVLWFVSGIFFIPTLFRKIKSLINDETLLILSLAFCFIMVILATLVGFSSALGAFIMGSILAETTKAEKIERLTLSIKNLFGAIFFVSVGMMIDPSMLIKYFVPIMAGTAVLIFGKPLFVTVGVLLSGQPLKIAVKSGMSLSQIGEFSFIIAGLGLSLNVTGDFLYPIAVAISVITTFTTPYMIRLSEPFYKFHESLLPNKWKESLTIYSSDAQHISEISDWKKLLKSYCINIAIFSVVILTIIFIGTDFLAPLFPDGVWQKINTAIITIVILSPFLWALAFRRTQRQAFANLWLTAYQRGPLIVLELSRVALAALYIGLLFIRLFSPFIALCGWILSCIIIALMYNRIKAFYGKIETHFMENYHEREAGKLKAVDILAPWDSHISRFEIDAHSGLIGKSLLELQLRERFGINIVSVNRGDFSIIPPSRDEHLFPNDKIAVLGTDEQLHKFEEFMESSIEKIDTEDKTYNISLHHFTVGKNSALSGKNIRESGIRELSRGIVVGVERNGERIINPESHFIFRFGDIVWLVGHDKQVQQILHKEAF